MISLEQIKLLEIKVESALQKIVELKNVNSKLQTENIDLQAEIELLQEQCTRFEQDEAKIEQGILSVLDRLNSVEDTVRQGGAQLVSVQIDEKQAVVQIQDSAPTSDVSNIEQTTVSIENTQSTTEQTVAEVALDAEETIAEITPVQQGTGMLNSAEKSAQLDIF